jgi:hypothetical protein
VILQRDGVRGDSTLSAINHQLYCISQIVTDNFDILFFGEVALGVEGVTL